MSKFELGYYISHDELIYKDGKPTWALEVPRQTAIFMDLYFRGEIEDPSLGRKFLAKETVGFVISAEKGFVADPNKVDRMNLASDEDRIKMLNSALTFVRKADSDDDTAFGYSLVVFYTMPYFARYHSLPDGFSKRGVLAPPETTGEFLDRLHELQDETTKIVNGETQPTKVLHRDPSLWRTGMFFQVAATLPLHI